MRINATGQGKRGTIEDGVGRLVCSHPADSQEARKLKVLFDELRFNNLTFWASIMLAGQRKKLTAAEEACLERIARRTQSSSWWEEAVGE